MQKLSSRKIGKTNLEVVTLGFGCASLGNLYHKVSDADAAETARSALDAGLRYFDTAPHYGFGLSERRVGDVLRREARDSFVLSSKVGRLLKPCGPVDENEMRLGFCSPMPFEGIYDYSYDGIMRSYEDSLQRLGLDRIDILYMHDIGRMTHGSDNDHLFKIAMESGYKALDELRASGQITAFGLGVNEYEVCEEAMEYGDFDCFLLAGRYTLLEQMSLDTFLPKCEARGASIVIGGAYNSGILVTGTKTGQTPHYNYEPAPEEIIERVRQLEAACDEYNIPLAAAALQFPLAHPTVASVIPGMSNPRRIKQTIELFTTVIPAEFWQALRDKELLHSAAPVPTESK
jgi:D-threo-aldose 1-dehydrogenase